MSFFLKGRSQIPVKVLPNDLGTYRGRSRNRTNTLMAAVLTFFMDLLFSSESKCLVVHCTTSQVPGRPLYNIASAWSSIVQHRKCRYYCRAKKSDSDVTFCLQFVKKKINLYTPLELTRIDGLLDY